MTDLIFGVSDAVAVINQTLDTAYPTLCVEGEVAEFKVNQGKFVFFNLKDDSASLGCFMMVFQLKFPLEDGMRVRILAQPKITQWGKFSLTVREVVPVGEGSLKKSFDALKLKLETEGLFAPERKRVLPDFPERVGVISSTQAAGYRDFIEIASKRWGMSSIEVLNTPVQGIEAPEKLAAAIRWFNQQTDLVDILAVIRGGGSADDLAAFNHEGLVRELAASRIPTIVGVGHETDVSLCDLAADVRAATPSNAAEIIFPDKKHLMSEIKRQRVALTEVIETYFSAQREAVLEQQKRIEHSLDIFLNTQQQHVTGYKRVIEQLNPASVLKRGYSLTLRGGTPVRDTHDVKIGEEIVTRLYKGNIISEVKNVTQ